MTSSNTGRGDDRVGVGPEYEAIRAEAAKLAPLFHAGTSPLGRWGAGLVDVEPGEDGKHEVSIIYPVVSRWEKPPAPRGNSLRTLADLVEIRATGIALLAYAEAVEAASRWEGRCYRCWQIIDPDVYDEYLDTPGRGYAHIEACPESASVELPDRPEAGR